MRLWVCIVVTDINQYFFLFQLREQMLTKMTTVLVDSPTNTTQEVQVTARAVAGLTQRSEELSPAAQVHNIRSELTDNGCMDKDEFTGVPDLSKPSFLSALIFFCFSRKKPVLCW